jgi:peptide/nickel transport system ATP-binding protein
MKLLEVKNLTTQFVTSAGTTIAVNDISFTLNRGETLGIVGESGSGKSVTALSVIQLLDSIAETSGEILFYPKNGEPVDLLQLPESSLRTYRGKEMGMIFQEPMTSLNPVFTCGNQLIETIRLHQRVTKVIATQKAIELLEKVQLPDTERILKSYPHQLSGGQKQRIMIAMAMSGNPTLLIADEPTTALDVTVQQEILILMKSLQQELEMAMIFITHDLGVIAKMANRVLVMYKGQIVEQGIINSILKTPKHPYTKGLLACRPPLDYRLSRLPTIDNFMETVTENGVTVIKEKAIDIETLINQYKVSQPAFLARQKALQSQSPILEVKNLSTYFTQKKAWWSRSKTVLKAVDDVSFEVFEGETLGLVGESGCGKTTLGRTILRLVEANSGQVFYENQSLFDLGDKEMIVLRKDIQIIFQDPYSSLNPQKTIGAAIFEPMKVHGILNNDAEREQRVIELLKTVALSPEHYHRYPHEFSGGQRQRVCIARALSVNPKFIICDECVSALDVSVQAQIINLLIELREKFNLTYIFISHDLAVVKLISDRIAVMKAGKIEELNDAESIYSAPQSEYTRQLVVRNEQLTIES